MNLAEEMKLTLDKKYRYFAAKAKKEKLQWEVWSSSFNRQVRNSEELSAKQKKYLFSIWQYSNEVIQEKSKNDTPVRNSKIRELQLIRSDIEGFFYEAIND